MITINTVKVNPKFQRTSSRFRRDIQALLDKAKNRWAYCDTGWTVRRLRTAYKTLAAHSTAIRITTFSKICDV